MAELQYIGARYVPKFFEGTSGSEWVSGVAYEALTIVTRNGNSYTSKIPVPASVGAPESNPTYWASTGIYNQQVEAYRQEVAGLAEELTNVHDTVDSLAPNKKYILIGDSLGLGISIEGGNPVTTKGWCGYFTDAIGADKCLTVSINGGGFTETGVYNWLYQLTNANMGDFDDTDFTDVIILGGTNDIDDTPGNVKIAIASMVQYIKNRFVNVNRIAIGALCEPTLSSRVHERYAQCMEYGCEYISDLERLLCDTSKYDSTGHTHLSQSGYGYYAPYIICAGLSGHCNYTFKFKSQASVYYAGGHTVEHELPYFYYTVTNNRTIVRVHGNTDTNATGDIQIRWVYTGTGLNYQGNTKVLEDSGDVCIVMDGDAIPPCRTSGIWTYDDASKALPFDMSFLGTRYQDHNAIYLSPLLDATNYINFQFNSTGNIIVN